MTIRRTGFKHEQLRPFGMRISDPMKLGSAALSGGMITSIDPAEIPEQNVQVARNMNVRMDKLARRSGTTLIYNIGTGAVLKYAVAKNKDGTLNNVVFAGTSVVNVSAGPVTMPATPLLTHVPQDRIRTAYILDKFVFSNNGSDPLQLINFAGMTVGPLGNAPRYRYVVGMFNRVVGAALRDVNEVEVGWSAEYPNITEFNPAINETAGNAPIIDSPDDLSDHITGLFALSNVGLLLRENSIWGITKQPIPQNPFYFYPAFSGLGCDTPNSAIRIRNGICFLDRKSGCIWAYYPNQPPEPIGQVVERTVLDMVTSPQDVFCGYSFKDDEYYLAIPSSSDIVTVWVYHFKFKQWTYHTRRLLTSIDEVPLTTGGATIDQLGEVLIDDLVGTIDSLSAVTVANSRKIYGEVNGNLAYEDVGAVLDANNDAPSPFESVITSKVFNIPTNIQTIHTIRVEFIMRMAGTLQLEYSKNNIDWTVVKTYTPDEFNVPLEIVYKLPIRARRLAWRITGSNGQWELLGYTLEGKPSGISRE